jgi:cysteinyl-tRNA synthetase
MHGNMLTVNGRKMAKSEGNGFTPEELITGNHKLLDKGYSPMTVRFFFLMGHYASTLDFSNEALQAAEKGYKRLMAAKALIDKLPVSASSDINMGEMKKLCADAMSDDFNTPVVIANLFEAVRWINSVKEGLMKITQQDKEELSNLFTDYTERILGLKAETEGQGESKLTGQLMEFILNLRIDAKANKDFATSDKIRNELGKMNVQIKDTKEGSTWSYEEN